MVEKGFLGLAMQVQNSEAEEFLEGGFFGGGMQIQKTPVVCLPLPPVRAPAPSLKSSNQRSSRIKRIQLFSRIVIASSTAAPIYLVIHSYFSLLSFPPGL